MTRQRRIGVLDRWVNAGCGVEVAGVYLAALGCTVLVADLAYGGIQVLQSLTANAELQSGQPESVPYLPLGQVSGLLWLAGMPLWGLGRAIRRSAELRLNHYASRGEPAGELRLRFAPNCPLRALFRG